jgi:formate-dependent nitrite reductase membrane component NrfD
LIFEAAPIASTVFVLISVGMPCAFAIAMFGELMNGASWKVGSAVYLAIIILYGVVRGHFLPRLEIAG